MNRRVLVVVGVPVLIGYAVSHGTFLAFLLLLMLAIVLFGLTILVCISDVVSKTGYFVYPGLCTICSMFAIASAVIFGLVRDQRREWAAGRIIAGLDGYMGHHGHYPPSLDSIPLADPFTGLHYFVDSTGDAYHLEYGMDGWHSKVYDSTTRKWYVTD